jgi:hypothetical protein
LRRPHNLSTRHLIHLLISTNLRANVCALFKSAIWACGELNRFNSNQQSAERKSPRANPPAFAGGGDLSIREKSAPHRYNFQFANFRTRALLRESFKIEPSNLHGLQAATEAL